MKRLGLFLAATLLAAASPTRAGELDSDFGGKAKATPSLVKPSDTPPPSIAGSGSELDEESPDQSWCHRWRRFGFVGYGYGYGYPRFGFGYYRGYGGFGYGRGFGGYGFRRGFW